MKTAIQIFRTLGPEMSMDQWDAIQGGKPRLRHGDSSCNGRQFGGEGHVFLCRGIHGCKRWFCACDGGGGDEHEENLCSKCWCKYQETKTKDPEAYLGYMQGRGAA